LKSRAQERLEASIGNEKHVEINPETDSARREKAMLLLRRPDRRVAASFSYRMQGESSSGYF
jgi:hypothetical protein